MIRIDFDLPNRLHEMEPDELGRHMVALLLAVNFNYDQFLKTIDVSEEHAEGIYATAMALFAQRWTETGKPDEGLDELVHVWQVITA